MTQQLRVTKKIDISGATKIGFDNIDFGIGKRYYLNGNTGSDGYGVQSQNPAYPMKTIAAALDLCTDYGNDYIIVMDHYQEAFPISVDVNGVHIVCAGAYNVGFPMVYLTASADTTIFDIAADFVEIAGFEFGSGASYAAIEWTGTKGYGLIRDCSFGRMQTGLDGIQVPSGFDAVEMIIQDCIFGAGLTRDGIRIDHNMTRGLIQRNKFLNVPGIGIDVTNSMASGIIADNRFALPADTAGKAVTLGASCADMWICGNWANFGDTNAMGTIPWVDGGTADLNTWDNNLTAGVVGYPA